MKIYALVLVLIFMAIVVSGKPNQAPPKIQDTPNPQARAPLPVNNQNETTYYANKADENPPRWYAALKRPEWWLVLVAALTGYVIWLQAKEMAKATSAMERQTEATRIAADAALLNAQAVINAERPWFVVTIELHMGYPGFYNIKITNKGRTPGILEEVFVETYFIENPSDLPSPPLYSNGCIGPNDNLFVTGDSYTIPPHFNASLEIEERRKSPNNNPTDLRIAYGKLTYSDRLIGDKSSEIIHETRWCFYWFQAEKRWVRCGSDEYMRHNDYPRKKA
jgi:hypothetical protein